MRYGDWEVNGVDKQSMFSTNITLSDHIKNNGTIYSYVIIENLNSKSLNSYLCLANELTEYRLKPALKEKTNLMSTKEKVMIVVMVPDFVIVMGHLAYIITIRIP